LKSWIDLSRQFETVEDLTTVYKDAVHYYDNRIRELAEEIAKFIRQKVTVGAGDRK
jgi:alpha/beta superfamily hydrolase